MTATDIVGLQIVHQSSGEHQESVINQTQSGLCGLCHQTNSGDRILN